MYKAALRCPLALLVLICCAVRAAPQSVSPLPPRQEFRVEGRRAFVIEPPATQAGPFGKPWVWYAPTLARYPGKAERWMFRRFLAQGIAIAGIDVGESYGSPRGRTHFDALFRELTKRRGYSTKPVLLARSRGGLMLYCWAVQNPDRVAGVAGIYPVCDLRSYPGLQRAAPAFDMTPAELAREIARHNPVDRLASLARARVPILHLHGDQDRVVPLEANSGALDARYRQLGGPSEVLVQRGKGHDMWKGWFESQQLTDFVVRRALRGAAVPVRPARLELASPFVDDMILQRGMKVPVWGWAKPASRVEVAFAGEVRATTADARGRWRVDLKPLTASSAGRDLHVRAAGEELVRRGVLVGEVWLASGQSNMDWIAGKSMCRDLARRLARMQADVPIREFNVDIGSSVFERSRAACKDGWKRCKRASAFSALALAFAAELHRELGVPIGILRATHGATAVETWTPYEGFAGHEKLQHIALAVRRSDPSTTDGEEAFDESYRALERWQRDSARSIEGGGKALPRPKLPGIAADWKGATRMFNKKIAPLIPFAIRGAIWCQGTHNAGDGRIYAAKMEALVRGWRKRWARPRLPFYFTQMQCYGKPDPNTVGFADIREAQRLFFDGAKHVGMVLQHDLNPSRPSAIHYANKLDPGKRLARWALAHEYGKDVAFSGPIYSSHEIVGRDVRVRFTQRGPGGGLMVGSKGMEADAKDGYVEPARETPGEPLRHFRLAGKDGVWHAAQARIDGDTVVVRSDAVAEPVGVQYAYSASPIGANLYNRAGLPATPFAYFRGERLFEKKQPPRSRAQRRPYVQIATMFRDGAVVQRDQPLPVWGFARPGVDVTVRFAGQTLTATADEHERWSVRFEPIAASRQGRDLVVRSSDEASRSVRDVVVGDLWVLTGTASLAGKLIKGARADLPLVREFRIRTKARRFREPRKRQMEIGGGKYRSRWVPMVARDGRLDATVAGYAFASQVAVPGVPLGLITLGADNPPLTWLSYAGLQTAEGFENERDERNLLYPNTASGRDAVRSYIARLRRYAGELRAYRQAGEEIPDDLAESAPVFPQPFQNQWARHTENATLTYNFCISPLTPMALRGVVWIPSLRNLGERVDRYGAGLAAYARSLPETYGYPSVAFGYAQPSRELVAGVSDPRIEGATRVEFDAWPGDFAEIASRLGAKLAARSK